MPCGWQSDGLLERIDALMAALPPHAQSELSRLLAILARSAEFAAGASQVLPVHELAGPYTFWAGAKQAIQALPMKPLLTKVVSAHVMGGCGAAGSDYGIVNRLAQGLAKRLSRKNVILA